MTQNILSRAKNCFYFVSLIVFMGTTHSSFAMQIKHEPHEHEGFKHPPAVSPKTQEKKLKLVTKVCDGVYTCHAGTTPNGQPLYFAIEKVSENNYNKWMRYKQHVKRATKPAKGFINVIANILRNNKKITNFEFSQSFPSGYTDDEFAQYLDYLTKNEVLGGFKFDFVKSDTHFTDIGKGTPYNKPTLVQVNNSQGRTYQIITSAKTKPIEVMTEFTPSEKMIAELDKLVEQQESTGKPIYISLSNPVAQELREKGARLMTPKMDAIRQIASLGMFPFKNHIQPEEGRDKYVAYISTKPIKGPYSFEGQPDSKEITIKQFNELYNDILITVGVSNKVSEMIWENRSLFKHPQAIIEDDFRNISMLLLGGTASFFNKKTYLLVKPIKSMHQILCRELKQNEMFIGEGQFGFPPISLSFKSYDDEEVLWKYNSNLPLQEKYHNEVPHYIKTAALIRIFTEFVNRVN